METYIGNIALFAFNFAPKGWMDCKGQLMDIAQNQALFALVGTTYGGDGVRNFALPTLKEPAEGLRYCIAVQGIFPSRP